MSDESRKAFEAAMREQYHWTNSLFVWTVSKYGNYYAIGSTRTAFQGWSARDAEVAALKARVEEAEAELKRQICPWCAALEGELR